MLKEGVNKVPQNAPPEEKSKRSSTSILFNEKKKNLDKKWAEMLEALPEDDVRYAVIDIFYETKEGSRAEIYFISW